MSIGSGGVGFGILLLAVLLAPARLRAQDPEPAPPPGFLEGFLVTSARMSRVHGSTESLLEGGALLKVGEAWRVGGVGVFMAGTVELGETPGLPASQLRVGYGGAVVERVLRAPLSEEGSGASRLAVCGRVLMGVGNANARDAVTRVRYLSDNFFMVEPTVSVSLPLGAWVNGGALLGYRIPLGVEDLGNLEENDLRGLSLGISLHLGPF